MCGVYFLLSVLGYVTLSSLLTIRRNHREYLEEQHETRNHVTK